VNEILKYMCEFWGIPSLYKSMTLYNLTATLINGIYLRNHNIYTFGQVRRKLQGVSYIVSKCHSP